MLAPSVGLCNLTALNPIFLSSNTIKKKVTIPQRYLDLLVENQSGVLGDCDERALESIFPPTQKSTPYDDMNGVLQVNFFYPANKKKCIIHNWLVHISYFPFVSLFLFSHTL